MFLDRDGVINRTVVRNGKPYPPATLDEFELLPGVRETMHALRTGGFLVIVVTNQPDVATGVQDQDIVEKMHDTLLAEGLCDDVKVCFHVEADGCECRKPKPGMLLNAARERNIDLANSFLVGDRWRDIEAGNAAGCRSFFIDYRYDEKRPEPPYTLVESLADAGKIILHSINP